MVYISSHKKRNNPHGYMKANVYTAMHTKSSSYLPQKIEKLDSLQFLFGDPGLVSHIQCSNLAGSLHRIAA